MPLNSGRESNDTRLADCFLVTGASSCRGGDGGGGFCCCCSCAPPAAAPSTACQLERRLADFSAVAFQLDFLAREGAGGLASEISASSAWQLDRRRAAALLAACFQLFRRGGWSGSAIPASASIPTPASLPGSSSKPLREERKSPSNEGFLSITTVCTYVPLWPTYTPLQGQLGNTTPYQQVS